MKIIVLIKEVPDTWGDRKLDLTTGIADRSASDRVVDEIGERSVELAVTLAGAHPGTEIVLLSLGPESAQASLRKALAMGASRAIHVQDARLAGADLTLTAEVLAAALAAESFDLVIAGDLSTDGKGGVIPSMLAELLGVPLVGNLTSVEVSGGDVRGVRASDYGTQQLTAPLPAIISITEQLPDPRFPNFKGIMAAKKRPIETRSLDDLGITAQRADAPRSIMVSVAETPARGAGITITDTGDAGTQLAAFLVENRLA